MVERLRCLVLVCLLAGCTKAPPVLALRDARLTDAQRGWMVDAQDEVAIARARIDDAMRAQVHIERHNDQLLERVKAADGALGPWQALARAREDLANLELQLANVRIKHAEARLRLVRGEVAVAADLAVIKLEPLRAEVDRLHARLVELVGEVEEATTAAETQADETWSGWQRHLGTRGVPNGFWMDIGTPAPVGAGTESQ